MNIYENDKIYVLIPGIAAREIPEEYEEMMAGLNHVKDHGLG